VFLELLRTNQIALERFLFVIVRPIGKDIVCYVVVNIIDLDLVNVVDVVDLRRGLGFGRRSALVG
jgi:hypothetical protein